MRAYVSWNSVQVNQLVCQGDVALNLYDFVVRRPGRATEKYGLRAYDEIILAPMVRVMSFSRTDYANTFHPSVCLNRESLSLIRSEKGLIHSHPLTSRTR